MAVVAGVAVNIARMECGIAWAVAESIVLVGSKGASVVACMGNREEDHAA